MPTSYIKKLAAEGHGSVESLEKKWAEAKEAATKDGNADNFAIVTTIFKNMLGASVLNAKARLEATSIKRTTSKMGSMTQVSFTKDGCSRKAWMTNFTGSSTWAAMGKELSASGSTIPLVNGEKHDLPKVQAEKLCVNYVETGRDYL